MLFERKHYLNLLQNADGNGMIKVITGIRRCRCRRIGLPLYFHPPIANH